MNDNEYIIEAQKTIGGTFQFALTNEKWYCEMPWLGQYAGSGNSPREAARDLVGRIQKDGQYHSLEKFL